MCARRNGSPRGPRPAEVPLVRGGFVGVLAWSVGFAATLAVTYVQYSSYLQRASSEFTLIDSVWFGLSTYANYHVTVLFGGSPGVSLGVAVVLVAIPATVMLVGGAVVAADREGWSVRSGASVAAGYFVAHLVAVAVLATLGDAPSRAVDAASLLGVLSNGFVQPAVLGALGGAAVR
jgi:hypothetical protein